MHARLTPFGLRGVVLDARCCAQFARQIRIAWLAFKPVQFVTQAQIVGP